CNAAKRRVTQSFAGCRLAILAEKESGLRTQVRMSPTIQYDSCDVPLSIEAIAAEHFRELFSNPRFIFAERRLHHLRATPGPLCFRGATGIRIQYLQRKHDWRIWTDGQTLNAGEGQLANLHVVADTFKPATAANSHLVQKPPAAHSNVRHHGRRAVKLSVST